MFEHCVCVLIVAASVARRREGVQGAALAPLQKSRQVLPPDFYGRFFYLLFFGVSDHFDNGKVIRFDIQSDFVIFDIDALVCLTVKSFERE